MKVREGFKYVVETKEHYPFPKWFPIQLRFPYEDARIKISRKGITLKSGFAWNGANAFPDHDWVMVPSAIHDGLLWWRHYHWEGRDRDETTDRELKRAIDQWFTDLCKARVPKWRKMTPTFMFFGVNVLSKMAPGPDQAEAHRIKTYE
jgi:hypothetical protein